MVNTTWRQPRSQYQRGRPPVPVTLPRRPLDRAPGGHNRRFYIPEEAGWGQGAGVPVFVAFPGRVWACREEGRGPGGAPGWTNDLEAGPPPGSHWISPGTAI